MGARVDQLAEVDESLHALVFRGGDEVVSGLQVPICIELTALQPVDQVIGGGDVFECGLERAFVQRVAGNHLDATVPTEALQARGVTHQAAHAVTCVEQARHEPAADITGRAGDEHQSIIGHGCIIRDGEVKGRI